MKQEQVSRTVSRSGLCPAVRKGTYYLAFRDLPDITGERVQGRKALDFGRGAGRSTRFLRELGFCPVVGADVSAAMVTRARECDPQGDYRLVPDGDLRVLAPGSFDLVLSALAFDNIPAMRKKVALLKSLGHLLNDAGRIVSLVSSPEVYVNEWASFPTKDFPENRAAGNGDRVKIVMLDVEDRRPVEDILWTDAGHLEAYERAGLVPAASHRPRANPSERFAWVTETTIAPWVIHVLERST